MQYWIQRADFSTEEKEASGVTELQRAFRSRSWSGELELEKSRHAAGEESCPPAFGIVPGDGRILRLCPSPTELLVHYHYPETKRVLGLFKTRTEQTVTSEVPLPRADELIRLFVARDHEGLIREMK
jgi:hypothetical protein